MPEPVRHGSSATRSPFSTTTRRSPTASGRATRPFRLRVPVEVIKAKCALYMQRGKPARRTRLMNLDDYTIVSIYGAEYRGTVQYYLLASDVYRLNRLNWVMETSMLKTLAGKHRSTVSKTAARYKAKVDTPHGPRTCFEATVERDGGRKPLVARYGGIPLRCQKQAVLQDHQPGRAVGRKELITRVLANRCEICERSGNIQVHHIRKLADLDNSTKRRGRYGRRSWQNGAASPLWSARTATTPSTPGSQPQSSRSSHWRAGCL